MRLTTICLRNLTHRKLRTSLCIFGVATATCFIIAVGATTSRYVEIIMEMNVFFREKIVVVPRKAIVIQGFPIGGIFQQNAVDNIKEVSGVEKVVPMIVVFGFELGENPTVMPANVTIGLPVKEWSLMISSATLEGRMPLENSTDEVVVGCSIANQHGISVGSKINMGGKEFSVCGIVEGPSALLGRSVIMNLEEAQNVFRYNGFISMAVVESKEGVVQDEVASEIENKISYVMALTDEERNALTKPIVDFVESWKIAIQIILLFLSMVLTAIVGIMSVSERRRDFATLDAIGARSSHIFQIILLENFIIGFLGSFLGIGFGVVVAAFLASFYTAIPINQFLSSASAIVHPLFMVEVVGLVVASCCVGGVIPAINASKIRISEILRAEY
ncbi:MAG: FtsX-like permease family protein [Candidatus Bathyarchaeia archaeon]